MTILILKKLVKTMYKISNRKNLNFIQQYVDQDVKSNAKEQCSAALLDAFISAVNEANLASADVLNVLNEWYLTPVCITSLLEAKVVTFRTGGNETIPESVENAFDELLLDVGQTEVEYNMSDSGRITFNK